MGSPHPVDVHVGKRLRLRRTLKGMSQEALGNAIGVTFQQIQKYERGINRMGSSRLFDFANILDVTVSYFFENFEEGKGKPAPGMAESDAEGFEHEDKISSRETLELVRSFYRISNTQVRRRVAELIKAIADDSSVLQP